MFVGVAASATKSTNMVLPLRSRASVAQTSVCAVLTCSVIDKGAQTEVCATKPGIPITHDVPSHELTFAYALAKRIAVSQLRQRSVTGPSRGCAIGAPVCCAARYAAFN